MLLATLISCLLLYVTFISIIDYMQDVKQTHRLYQSLINVIIWLIWFIQLCQYLPNSLGLSALIVIHVIVLLLIMKRYYIIKRRLRKED